MIIGKKGKKPTVISDELKIEYRIENEEVEFVKYLGEEDEYTVPETIEGYPVVKIAPYAFAERRTLYSVDLPRHVRIIGAHAFYNCRGLYSLGFYDELVDIEDGAFKNCYMLSHLLLRTNPEHKMVLKNILMDTADGLLVTIYYENEHGSERAELIFPPYLVEFAENTPARIFEKQAYGSGERYRHCLYSGLLDFEQYDQLLSYSIAVDDMEYPIQCAMNRLRYPYRLKEDAKKQYEYFVKKEISKVLEFYIKREDADFIRWMLDEKMLSKADMNLASELCRKHGKNGLLPMLVEYQNVNYKPKKKSFTL